MEKERIVLQVSSEFIEFLRKNTPERAVFGEYWGQVIEDELYSYRKQMFEDASGDAQ